MAQREILFRGKALYSEEGEGGDWIQGDLIYKKKPMIFVFDFEEHPEIPGNPIEDMSYEVAIDPETLGQYTGLKDKNGVKIFEGDVVKSVHWNPDTYFIEFRSGAFCLTNPSLNIPIDIEYLNDFEIIGNIHDNPELLTK